MWQGSASFAAYPYAPSLSLSCFHNEEVFLIPYHNESRVLNGPVKVLQPDVYLVAHPVGSRFPRRGRRLVRSTRGASCRSAARPAGRRGRPVLSTTACPSP